MFDQQYGERQISVNWRSPYSQKNIQVNTLIVNVSSVTGLHGYPGLSTYFATKHAIEAVSSCLVAQ